MFILNTKQYSNWNNSAEQEWLSWSIDKEEDKTQNEVRSTKERFISVFFTAASAVTLSATGFRTQFITIYRPSLSPRLHSNGPTGHPISKDFPFREVHTAHVPAGLVRQNAGYFRATLPRPRSESKRTHVPFLLRARCHKCFVLKMTHTYVHSLHKTGDPGGKWRRKYRMTHLDSSPDCVAPKCSFPKNKQYTCNYAQ